MGSGITQDYSAGSVGRDDLPWQSSQRSGERPGVAGLPRPVAVITGGSRGIGQALVTYLTDGGAEVVFSGRNKEKGREVAVETGAIYVEGNVCVQADIERTVAAAAKITGKINLLVNNAGISVPYAGIQKVLPDDFTEYCRMFVTAAVAHTQAALPYMPQGSSIINIASISGYRAISDGRVHYAVAKAALQALTYHMAPELKHFGIRMNCISPGKIGNNYDVVVDVIMFLLSPQARYITGIDLVVDDGLICGPTYHGER